MVKKILSIMLCLCLLLSLFSYSGIISIAAEGAVFTEDGLTLNKTAVMNSDGKTATVTLEAYTTGKVSTIISAVPMDIVLVLDQSGSMTYSFSDTTRQQAMKAAVNGFIDMVSKNAIDNKVNHNIGVVKYGSDSSVISVLSDMSNENNKTALKSKIEGLPNEPTGATRADLGMNVAKSMLDSAPRSTGRSRIVIVFTDGVPTSSSDFETDIATAAIVTSKALKDSGTVVYTIGIFDGAKVVQLHGDKFDYEVYDDVECSGEEGSIWGASWLTDLIGDIRFIDIAAGNRFLNFLSNNYKDSDNIGIVSGRYNPSGKLFGGGDGYQISKNFVRTSTDYYMTASDTAGLGSVFKIIFDTAATPTISLGPTTVIKDVVSDYFYIPGNVSDIKLYEAAYNGVSFGPRTSSTAAAKIEGTSLSVSGFDFDKNFVTATKKADNSFGKKLVIEFTISVRDGFFGGAAVPTNNPVSGVYNANESLVKAFPQPKVDVPLRYVIGDKEDYHIYCTGSVELKELVTFMESNEPEENFKPDGWNNDFVTIAYTLKDSAGTPIATYMIAPGETTGVWSWLIGDETISPMGNTLYTVECAVTSGEDNRMLKDDLKSQTNIYVYFPHITYQDSNIYLGEAADYGGNLQGVAWKTKNQTDNWSYSPAGNAPVLTYAYSPEAGFLQKDTDVDAKVSIGGLDITEYTTFVNDSAFHNGLAEKKEFTVHVKTCTLTLTKSGWESIDEGQSFIFNVKGSNNVIADKINMYIVVQGEESVTITGLPIGEYSIAEDTSWSWRYAPKQSAYIASLNPSAGLDHASLAIENERLEEKWLDGNGYAKNIFNQNTNK